MCSKNRNHRMYASWDMKCDKHDFLQFWSIFCHTDRKNENLEKNVKTKPGDIILLHICSINEDHMRYGLSDIRLDRHIFLSFWAIFCTDSPNNPKNQNFEKIKKKMSGDIILHMCTVNEYHIMYSF